MNQIQTTVNIDEAKNLIAESLLYSDSTLLFLDTNIIIWLFRLNQDSYIEFSRLLKDLAERDMLIIPNWVIHEYNNLILSNSESLFYPYRKRIKTLVRQLDGFVDIALLKSDNANSKKNGYVNKINFIDLLKSEIESIKKKIQSVSPEDKFSNDKRKSFVEELFSIAKSSFDVSSISQHYEEFSFRYNHKIPPGFEDKSKESNKYGDAIIWKEIIHNCKTEDKSNAVFLSLDMKIDWVYKPSKIIMDGKTIYNNQKQIQYSIHPWLASEFSSLVKNGKIAISNISTAVEILYSPDINQIMFEDFKHLAKTVDIELNNSETNKLLEWFIVNGHKAHEVHQHFRDLDVTLGEFDEKDIKRWCKKHGPSHLNYSEIDWGSIIINMFI